MASILDMADTLGNDSDDTNLNPNAKAFVPSWLSSSAAPANSVHSDDEQQQHVQFSPSEHSGDAYGTQWQQHEPAAFWTPYGGADRFHGFGTDYAADHASEYAVDDSVAFYLQREEELSQHLHKPPQQPKGNTFGRARSQHQSRWGPRAA